MHHLTTKLISHAPHHRDHHPRLLPYKLIVSYFFLANISTRFHSASERGNKTLFYTLRGKSAINSAIYLTLFAVSAKCRRKRLAAGNKGKTDHGSLLVYRVTHKRCTGASLFAYNRDFGEFLWIFMRRGRGSNSSPPNCRLDRFEYVKSNKYANILWIFFFGIHASTIDLSRCWVVKLFLYTKLTSFFLIWIYIFMI